MHISGVKSRTARAISAAVGKSLLVYDTMPLSVPSRRIDERLYDTNELYLHNDQQLLHSRRCCSVFSLLLHEG